jgi:hypothetical protein
MEEVCLLTLAPELLCQRPSLTNIDVAIIERHCRDNASVSDADPADRAVNITGNGRVVTGQRL